MKKCKIKKQGGKKWINKEKVNRTYHYYPTDKILVAIYALSKIGWTNKELSNLFFLSLDSIKRYKIKGYKKLKHVNPSYLNKSKKGVQISYVGSTKDLEYIDGRVNQNICDGGRRKKTKHYNSAWEVS